MCLPVEVMIADGRIRGIDALMHELITHARETWSDSMQGRVWDISDRIGMNRGRKALWEFLKKRFLVKDVTKIYDQLEPFAICDLRR
jgi:hypothetical protein